MRGISEESLKGLPFSRFPMPPAEAPNPEPHTPSADIGPKVSEHG